MTAELTRYVIHLPVVASDLTRAHALARTVARALSFLTAVDPGETTVSEEDVQGVRHRVFGVGRLRRPTAALD